MKKFFLPFLLVVVVFSLTYVSIYYLPFPQFEPYHKSDSELVELESILSDLGRIRSSQSVKNLTIISMDSEEVSAITYPYEPPLIINNPELCKNSPDLDFIVYVYSAIEDFDGRQLLRETWFNTQLFKNIFFKVAFFLGRDNDDVQQKVEEEADKYQDIVQGDFVDGYNNLTLKAVMGLKWISTYCPNARYAVKADDDVFVNIFEVARLLKENRHKSSVILCNVILNNTMPILRDPKTCKRSCVKDTDFPGRDAYPQYCSGPFYTISSKLVKSLYEASKSTPFFFIEDVYVTALLTQKIPDKIDYLDLSRQFTLDSEVAFDLYKNLTQPITLYIVHDRYRSMSINLWNALLDRLTDSQKALLQRGVSYYRVN